MQECSLASPKMSDRVQGLRGHQECSDWSWMLRCACQKGRQFSAHWPFFLERNGVHPSPTPRRELFYYQLVFDSHCQGSAQRPKRGSSDHFCVARGRFDPLRSATAYASHNKWMKAEEHVDEHPWVWPKTRAPACGTVSLSGPYWDMPSVRQQVLMLRWGVAFLVNLHKNELMSKYLGRLGGEGGILARHV